MIAGHFGLAAGVKARGRQVPLWALMLATVWLDIVFAPLLAAGVESIENVPGTGGGYGKSIIHADWTHSLVGALVLAALFGLVAARPWGRRTGAVLGAVVFSHWLLDLAGDRITHPKLARLAETMNQQQQDHLQQPQGWLDSRGLAPLRPPVGSHRRKESDLTRLSEVRGAGFDLAFLEVMAARHPRREQARGDRVPRGRRA